MCARRVGILAAAAVIAIASRAHAGGLGFEFGGGPVLASHGSLANPFAPDVAARFALVARSDRWAADAGMLVFDQFGELDHQASLVAISAGVRRALPFAAGVRNGVAWRFALYGAFGCTYGWLESHEPVSGAAARTTTGAGAEPAARTVIGPRLGAGIEVVLQQGLARSRVGLGITDQEMYGTPDHAGGFVFAELSIATTFGH